MEHKLAKAIESWTERCAARVGNWRWVRRHTDRLGREGAAVPTSSALSWWRIAAAIAFLGSIAWFLGLRIGAQAIWPPPQYTAPGVYNLTQHGVEWDVYYGSPVSCGALDCHLTPDYPEGRYTKKMVLPAREFPLLGYEPGQLIYLRTTVELPQDIALGTEPLVFNTFNVWAERYSFYVNGTLLDEGGQQMLNVTLPREMIKQSGGKLFLAVKIDPGKLPYQGIAHRADIAIGAKATLLPLATWLRETKTTNYLWVLLPKMTFCIVFTFLFLAVSQNREVFAFVLFSFLASAEIFMRTAYVHEMLPFKPNWEHLSITTRNFAHLVFIMFVHLFFRRRSVTFRKVWTAALIALASFSLAAHYVIPYEIAYRLSDAVEWTLKPIGHLYGMYESLAAFAFLQRERRSPQRAKIALILFGFFALSLTPILTSTYFGIVDAFGLLHNRPYILIFGASVVDLVFFIVLSGITATEFGITVMTKQRVQAELTSIEERLELARSVQQLLMPKRMEGGFGRFQYRFHHEPAEKMAGDWLNVWETKDGECRLFMGDVVGKGPQAALAVSVIATAISESKRERSSVEACIARVNTRLLDLFGGHINSTLSAIALGSDGSVRLYGCGAGGWVMIEGDSARYVPVQGSLLGMKDEPRIGMQELRDVSPATAFLSFTDGCLDGSRAVKALLRKLGQNGNVLGAQANAQEFLTSLGKLVLQVREEVVQAGVQNGPEEDDRTMMLVSAA